MAMLPFAHRGESTVEVAWRVPPSIVILPVAKSPGYKLLAVTAEFEMLILPAELSVELMYAALQFCSVAEMFTVQPFLITRSAASMPAYSPLEVSCVLSRETVPSHAMPSPPGEWMETAVFCMVTSPATLMPSIVSPATEMARLPDPWKMTFPVAMMPILSLKVIWLLPWSVMVKSPVSSESMPP